MEPGTPITLATAGYGSLGGALLDHEAVWGARQEGLFHHSALAVLSHRSDDVFRIERADNTARYLTWGDGLLAGAVFVLLSGGRFQLLPTWDTAGRRAVARHFNRHIEPDDLASAAAILEGSRFGLLAVVVNRAGREVRAQLRYAQQSYAVDMVWSDLEEELRRDLVESPTRPDSALVSPAEPVPLRPRSHGNLPSRRRRLSP